jgi:hypothetical protein
MWEPVGPLPASVYWRRRCVAVASTLGSVVAISWLVAALLTPVPPGPVETALTAAETPPTLTADPAPGDAPAGDAATTAATPTAATTAAAPTRHDPAVVVLPAPVPAPSPSPSAPPPPPPAAVPTVPAPAPAGRYGFGPNARAAQLTEPSATEQLLPDDTPRRTGPPATPVPLPSTGPAACPDSALAVAAEVDPATHPVGGRPRLRLVVTNVSDRPCLRDLDAARQEIVVWGPDGSRMWSSNDCSRAAGVDLRTLVPGQPAVFAVTWAGRTSVPGCTGPRTTVPAGTYNVMTRVDDVISAAVPMVRTP